MSKRSASPKTRNEALEMAMRRGQQKALGKQDTDSEDDQDPPQRRTSASPPQKRAASPTTRNEALEMAMKRGQQKAGLTKDDDEDDDNRSSASSQPSKTSATAGAPKPKNRNEALEMAMARGKAKAGLAGEDAVAVGSPEHKKTM